MNELLLWISALGAGTDAAFKRRAAELLPAARGGPAAHNRAGWALGSLGHCEFGAAADGGWRVAPPVLAAGDPRGPTSAILCGARSAPLLAGLQAAAGDLVTIEVQPGAPDLVIVRAPSAAELSGVAAAAGIPVQWNAPLAALAAIQARPLVAFPEIPLPSGGWTVSRFSRSRVAWAASSVAEAGRKRRGLFRFASDRGTTHVFRHGPASREVPPAVAKYWVLGRRQRAMRVDLPRGLVSFPAVARPPGLADRALVLCSGRLPAFADGRIVYSGVTAPVAAAVSAALRAIAEGAD